MSGCPSPRQIERDERGAFLILFALLVVGMLTMAAIVLDLSQYRQDRRQSRLAADSAATSGTLELRADGPSRTFACGEAWRLALENLGQPPNSSPCPTSFASPANDCDSSNPAGATPLDVTKTAGPYTIRIVTPVLDTSPLMKSDVIGADIAQETTSSFNGGACSRLAVEITRTREPFFGGIVGQGEKITRAHSVALRLTGFRAIPANLVVLEPRGCPALGAGGNTSIELTSTSAANPGGIVVVSDATDTTCTGTTTLDVGTGSTNGHVASSTPGDIYLGAMPLSAPSCTASPKACREDQYDPPLTDHGFFPYPLPMEVPIDRSLVDYTYNCRSSSYTGGGANYRQVFRARSIYSGYVGPTLTRCTDQNGTALANADYINKLVRAVDPAYGGSALDITAAPTNTIGANPSAVCPLDTYTTIGNTIFNCQVRNGSIISVAGNAWFKQTSDMAPSSITVTGNVRMDGGFTIGTGNSISVSGNMMVNGPITTAGSAIFRVQGDSLGTLCANATYLTDPSCFARSKKALGTGSAAFLYVRPPASGTRDISLKSSAPGGNFLDHTLVFAAANPTNDLAGVTLSVGAGAGVTWSPPDTGPFRNLAFWSDLRSTSGSSGTGHLLSGGGALNLGGVYFSPLSQVTLGGGSATNPLEAQFFAAVLQTSGNATFRMTPGANFIQVPVSTGTRLIR